MKWIILALMLTACYEPSPAENHVTPKGQFPSGVQKFADGGVVCYVYFQHSISCVAAGRR